MKAIYCVFGLATVLACRVATAAPSVVISEFMAINNTTLADEDGDYSDWIELYNSSTNTVDLHDWYLTDRATNLTHWKFPSTNLGPSDFMVVFASNKNRRVPGAPLHTNFKLSGSGEYLALVMPDGVTKATEFAPAFPQQYADISYGYAMTGAVRTFIAPNAGVRALVPASDLDPGWRLVGYNDSTWASGTLGAGYDTSGNYAPVIGLDLGAAMFNVNPSAYLRVPFTVDDPYALTLLTLSLRYDMTRVGIPSPTAAAFHWLRLTRRRRRALGAKRGTGGPRAASVVLLAAPIRLRRPRWLVPVGLRATR